MKSIICFILACAAPFASVVATPVAEDEARAPSAIEVEPQLLVFDYASMLRTRSAIAEQLPIVQPAYHKLLKDADAVLRQKPLSVMDKTGVAASGDKHDYFDIGNYSWPNPQTANGLPYVRRDGRRNPEANGSQFDKRNYNTTLRRIRVLALAYFYSGDERYAAKGAELLRTWFIAPATRMNPNMNHAAALPGVSDGSYIGIINTVALITMLDSVKLLSPSENWTEADQHSLKQWFSSYTDWLLNSEFGKKERNMRNNHGTWYAAQVAAYALYYDAPHTLIEQMVALGRGYVDEQFAADGSMPAELRRNRSLMYSRYGLRAFIPLARAGEFVGADLWQYKTKDGIGLETAFNFIAPYLSGEKQWGHEEDKLSQATIYAGSVELMAYPARIYDSAAIRRSASILNPLTNPLALEGANRGNQTVWLHGYLQFADTEEISAD